MTLRLALAKFRLSGQLARRYRANRPGATPGEVLGSIASDLLMRVPANRLADARIAFGNTYLYEFGWRTPVDNLGACHALEIPFVFDTLDRPGSVTLAGADAPRDLAEAMHGAWIRFARDGRPGWQPWDVRRPVMRFDLPWPAVVHAPADDELALWR